MAYKNIKLNLDIINRNIGPNSVIPTDFPTVKNAILNNERQIRALVTQVTTAALMRPSSQRLLSALKNGNTSEIINQLQEQF